MLIRMASLKPGDSEYLRTSDKCIIQPHVAAHTTGAWRLSELECLENIKACLTTGIPIAPVNWVDKRDH